MRLGSKHVRAAFALLGVCVASAAGAQGGRDYILIVDEKASAQGGACNAGVWVTRDLNMIFFDGTGGLVTVDADRFGLPAGAYEAFIRAPGVSLNRHRIRLRNVTADPDETVAELAGAQSFSDENSFVQTDAVLQGRFVIEAPTQFEVQHRCGHNPGAFAFGVDPPDGTPGVYTTVQLYREPLPDLDQDGILDHADNCVLVAQTLGTDDCDSDSDGYGNGCDADYDDDGVVGLSDLTLLLGYVGQTFPDEFDANCDGSVEESEPRSTFGNSIDFGSRPGPSGLACAGTPPCPTP